MKSTLLNEHFALPKSKAPRRLTLHTHYCAILSLPRLSPTPQHGQRRTALHPGRLPRGAAHDGRCVGPRVSSSRRRRASRGVGPRRARAAPTRRPSPVAPVARSPSPRSRHARGRARSRGSPPRVAGGLAGGGDPSPPSAGGWRARVCWRALSLSLSLFLPLSRRVSFVRDAAGGGRRAAGGRGPASWGMGLPLRFR